MKKMFDLNELYANRIGEKNQFNKKCLSSFVKIQRAKEEAINKGYEVLDFGNSEPCETDNEGIISFLDEKINKMKLKDDDKNISLEFNKACAGYLRVEHGVDLDYKNEIVCCNSVKELLNFLPLAFINKGDYVITTIPGYIEKINMNDWLESNVYEYKLNKFNSYLIDFEDIDENVLKKCKMLYLNYPNNPTGAVATKEFFKEVVKYAKKYNFIVVHDASDIDLCFDDIDKISFLSTEGAKDVGIELYDLSNNYNMNKWKMGFVAGNKDIIKVFSQIKDNLGLENFFAKQKMAINVLNNYEMINKKEKEKYLRRHKLIKEVLKKHGFNIEIPKASFYQYVSVPKKCNGVSFESAEEFALWFIENVNIMVIPYDVNGKYIRISMAFAADNEEKEKEVAIKLDEKLSKFKFDF